MKKSLIALAALATVGAAQAQSSVTVYGTYDLGYGATKYENVDGSTSAGSLSQKSAGIVGSPLTSNRFGLRGTEDLGGGLKANFNLEFGFANNLVGDTITTGSSTSATAAVTAPHIQTANGGGDIQTRTSRVGLESAKLGRLDIGYGLTGLFATVSGHSPLPGNNWVGDLAYTSNSISGADERILAGAVRASGVQYTSRTINGVQAVVDYGSGSYKYDNDSANGSRVSNAGLTLRYAAGPLALAATTHQLKTDYVTTSNQILTTDFTAISARYSVTSSLALNALYATNKTTGVNGTQTGKNDVTQVGASYTMGKNVLVAQYGTGDGKGDNTAAAQRDRKGYQVGAIHNLSKRTNVYAIYGSQEEKYISTNVTEKLSGYAVGVRHSF